MFFSCDGQSSGVLNGYGKRPQCVSEDLRLLSTYINQFAEVALQIWGFCHFSAVCRFGDFHSKHALKPRLLLHVSRHLQNIGLKWIYPSFCHYQLGRGHLRVCHLLEHALKVQYMLQCNFMHLCPHSPASALHPSSF